MRPGMVCPIVIRLGRVAAEVGRAKILHGVYVSREHLVCKTLLKSVGLLAGRVLLRSQRAGPSARLLLKGAQMLRYVTSTLTACALAGVVSLSAQEPAPAQQPAPPQQQEHQQAPKETLT